MEQRRVSDEKQSKYVYPPAPYMVGLDWIEWRVAEPAKLAATLLKLGFTARSPLGEYPRVAIGGLVIALRPASADEPLPPQASLVIQIAVNDIDRHFTELQYMALPVTRPVEQPRGDIAFEWRDPSGLCFRFVGPKRLESDPTHE